MVSALVASVIRPVSVVRYVLAPVAAFATMCSLGSAQAQAAPAPAPAQEVHADDTIRLTDEQREAVLDRNTVESAAAARGEMTGPDRAKLEVHGEVSAFVGSHGSRGIAGTAAVPLGDNAQAVMSFESEQFGRRR